MGALPASTCRSSAVAAVLVELLSMSRLGPATLPTSLLMAFTVLVFPRSKRDPAPVPAKAVETTPTVRARMNAKPTKNTVALPTHITFEATLLIICPSPSFLALSLLLATQPTRCGVGSYPQSKRRAGSCPAPSRGVARGVGWPRNEGSILLSEGSVCAPWNKVRQSTKEARNFGELRYGEVRGLGILGSSL